MNCTNCGESMDPCIHAGEKMRVRHWYCLHCGHDDRAIGRERLLTLDDAVEASIDAFVEMRLDRNPAGKGCG